MKRKAQTQQPDKDADKQKIFIEEVMKRKNMADDLMQGVEKWCERSGDVNIVITDIKKAATQAGTEWISALKDVMKCDPGDFTNWQKVDANTRNLLTEVMTLLRKGFVEQQLIRNTLQKETADAGKLCEQRCTNTFFTNETRTEWQREYEEWRSEMTAIGGQTEQATADRSIVAVAGCLQTGIDRTLASIDKARNLKDRLTMPPPPTVKLQSGNCGSVT